MKGRRALNTVFSSTAPGVTYLYRDDFITDDNAPMTTPRTAEPGPGTSDVTDTGNNMSVTGGELVVTGGVGTYNPQVWVPAGSAVAAQQGLCAMSRIKIAAGGVGAAVHYWDGGGQAFIVQYDGIQCADLANTGDAPGTGYHSYYYIWDATTLDVVGVMDNKVLGTYPTLAGGTAARPRVGSYTGRTFTVDYVRVAVAGGAWSTTPMIRTAYSANPAPNATFTMGADSYISYQWEWDAGVHNLYFRRVDDDNSLIVRMDKTADTIKLIKREAASETELGSANLTTGGYYPWIQLICDGQRIKIWSRQVAKIEVTNSAYNLTATGAKVASFTNGQMALKGISIYPRTVPAAALAELQKIG